MKLCCVLILFTIVKVLAVTMADYKKSISFTNTHIERASTTDIGLLPVVREIITGHTTMDEIALMLAVPELANVLHNLQDCLIYEEILRTLILNITFYPLPLVNDNQNFDDYKLLNLGVSRRYVTRDVIKVLIQQAINGDEPVFKNFAMMCRLIGLFRNIVFNDTIIIAADVDIYGNCNITDLDKKVRQYTCVNNEILEFQIDTSSQVTQTLRHQVTEWTKW
ncbi:uncharacterized protein LOC126845983 [Adelges cooleyi]|uniref:uncharacterized protein LOC126845983 n=1 Tax=Adelges cooleyi TaxID=133065 RepID=UPI0021802CB9|nr:uncharacterized protein LOC126845983 [Adelges cooleyi]